MSDTFDYVIVGGGTAAGILAYRLGETGRSVCVLEAGPPDRDPFIHIPAGFSKTLGNPSITWQLKSEPDPNSGNRRIVYTQGKTLGGSSSVNGMIYNRGQASDFDNWAQAGNWGWTYDEILPFFRRSERRIHGDADPAYRGNAGAVAVTTAQWPNSVETAMIEAALNAGHPFNSDYNGARQEGVGTYQSTIWRGRRQSTAAAFLRPARRRFDVDIRTHALVTRINLAGRRATGIIYERSGHIRTMEARREVIVSAGTVNSPKLLQLSGIGPGAFLTELGIGLQHELAGVGENFHDHFSPRIVARAKPGVDSINLHVTGLPLVWQMLRWAVGLPNVLALSPARVHVFGKSDPALESPDYSLMFAPASFKGGLVGVLDDFPGMTFGAWQMRPQSRGYVRVRSADPREAPRINAHYLAEPADRRVLLAGMRAARRIMATAPLSSLIEQELFPGIDTESDEELLAFARDHGATSFHLVGTCKMGPPTDSMAVVDPRLRVHGIDGLRVIDASIMPAIPSANTYASTMMIAEKGAAMILEDAR